MIFRKLFRRKRSSKIAKERLEILLVTDRIGCNPYTTESIKKDLIRVISKYIEIDTDKYCWNTSWERAMSNGKHTN